MNDKTEYILIVDDSQTNNVLLEAVLAESNFPSQTALSAAEAWNIIHKQRPALILLDLLMPKISGFQLLERMKAREEYKDIPVIIVSALNEPDTIRLLKEMGAIDFFSKPLNIQGLLKKIGEVFPEQQIG
jgi:two-component system, cell cycle response regulator DivK